MATGTYIPLQTITLTSNASSVTFSSLPSKYKDFVFVAKSTSSAVGPYDQGIQFNGDTAANYTSLVMYGSGTAKGTYNALKNVNQIYLDFYGSVTSGFNTVNVTHILGAGDPNKETNVITQASRVSSGTDLIGSYWRVKDQVTSISYFLIGGTLGTGSKISLYGIER